jgi:hypothetical protein
MKIKLTIAILTITSTLFSQKISVKEINESRTTSDNSYNNKCEIILKVSGDEVRKYKSVKISKISKAIDDKGIDLLNEENSSFDYVTIDQDSRITFDLKVPARKAEVIKEISGEICLYNPTELNGGIVKILNYQNKTNINLLPNNSPVQVVYLTKESYAKYVKDNKDKKEEELKKMPAIARNMVEGLVSAFDGMFGMDENDPNQALFYINGEESKFVDLYFEDTNGKKIEHNGKSSSNNLISYSFNEKPNPNWKLILNIESNNSIKKIPFTIKEIELP